MEIPAQSSGHMDLCDGRGPLPLTPTSSSELSPGTSVHWERDHLGTGMVTSSFVPPSAGSVYPISVGLP